METYKASLDTTSKILTGFIFLFPIFVIVIWKKDSQLSDLVPPFIIIGPLIIFTYLFRIMSYEITDEKVIIKRPISIFDKGIALSGIESVKILTKEDFSGTIRTFGNGGLFGYTGYYANDKLGSFRMFATSGKSRILIILKDKKGKIVISPDDTTMVDALQKRLNKPA